MGGKGNEVGNNKIQPYGIDNSFHKKEQLVAPSQKEQSGEVEWKSCFSEYSVRERLGQHARHTPIPGLSLVKVITRLLTSPQHMCERVRTHSTTLPSLFVPRNQHPLATSVPFSLLCVIKVQGEPTDGHKTIPLWAYLKPVVWCNRKAARP